MRYATGIDCRDWTLFTENCELDYGEIGSWTGVDEVTHFTEKVHALAGYTLHRLSTQQITVNGDSAVARTYVDAVIMAVDNRSGGRGVNGIGFYDDETQGQWHVFPRGAAVSAHPEHSRVRGDHASRVHACARSDALTRLPITPAPRARTAS